LFIANDELVIQMRAQSPMRVESLQFYRVISSFPVKIFYHGLTPIDTDSEEASATRGPLSVSIRVHPWLNDFGCGWAELRPYLENFEL